MRLPIKPFFFLLITLSAIFSSSHSVIADSQIIVKEHIMNYQDFLTLATNISVGMKQQEIIEILGEAAVIDEVQASWHYHLFDREGFPGIPRAGSQVFSSVKFIFDADTLIDIQWAWIDATGPAPTDR